MFTVTLMSFDSNETWSQTFTHSGNLEAATAEAQRQCTLWNWALLSIIEG